MRSIKSILAFTQSDTAQYRLKIIEFLKQYGPRITVDAFAVSRATIYRWRRALILSKGRLESLVPASRKPHGTRRMHTHPAIVSFIRTLRETYGHLGKEKIKPLLDEYCEKHHIPSLAVSTIGKVIKRYNLYVHSKRIYHNPSLNHPKKHVSYRTRVKRSPSVTHAGYLEIDTITRFIDGMKIYIFNAVDVKLKFQFSYGYTRLNSLNGRDFLQKLELVYPLQNGMKTIQTDNGLEFMGEFDVYTQERKISHVFIYPRCPRINGFIERANRTLQEEFVEGNQLIALENMQEFNARLMDYLVWYNTKRVHKSLGNITPINYLLSILPQESQMYVTYTTS